MKGATAPERREEKMAGVSRKSLCFVLRRVNIVSFMLMIVVVVVGAFEHSILFRGSLLLPPCPIVHVVFLCLSYVEQ